MNFPIEIIQEYLEYIDIWNLSKFRLIDKKYKLVIDSDIFMKKILIRDFMINNHIEEENYKEYYKYIYGKFELKKINIKSLFNPQIIKKMIVPRLSSDAVHYLTFLLEHICKKIFDCLQDAYDLPFDMIKHYKDKISIISIKPFIIDGIVCADDITHQRFKIDIELFKKYISENDDFKIIMSNLKYNISYNVLSNDILKIYNKDINKHEILSNDTLTYIETILFNCAYNIIDNIKNIKIINSFDIDNNLNFFNK